MAGLKIDLDRDILYEVPAGRRPPGGVVIRKDAETNADVFMYKNQPGVYYSANGIEVSATMAKRAGFDVERYARAREKIQKMKDFAAKYEADQVGYDRRIVTERNGYKLVDLGGNRYIIEDTEGNNMTPGKNAATEQHGLDWLTDFAGPDEVANGNVSGVGGPGEGGTDRRSSQDGPGDSNVRQPGNKKTPV